MKKNFRAREISLLCVAILLSSTQARSTEEHNIEDNNIKTLKILQNEGKKNPSFSSARLTSEDIDRIFKAGSFVLNGDTYVRDKNDELFLNDKVDPNIEKGEIKLEINGDAIIEYTLSYPKYFPYKECSRYEGDTYLNGKYYKSHIIGYNTVKTCAYGFKCLNYSSLSIKQDELTWETLLNNVEANSNAKKSIEALYKLSKINERNVPQVIIEENIQKDISNKGDFATLNKGVFGLIMEFLSNKDFLNLSQCSKGMQELCNTDYSWKIIAKNNKIKIPEENNSVKEFVKMSISEEFTLSPQEGPSDRGNFWCDHPFYIYKHSLLKAMNEVKIFKKNGEKFKITVDTSSPEFSQEYFKPNERIFISGTLSESNKGTWSKYIDRDTFHVGLEYINIFIKEL